MSSDRLREKTGSVMKVNPLIAKSADTREFEERAQFRADDRQTGM